VAGITSGVKSLEATEYGLDYAWISKTINPVAFENGLHFLGLVHSFIKFPKTVQTIEFSNETSADRRPIESRTSDGLEVILEISFQYTLQKENLYNLYNRYALGYHNVFQNIAIDILTEEATKYTAYEFFWDRGKIKEDFQMALNNHFSKNCFADIQFLQLRSVDLPPAFEGAIQESEVSKQDIKKAEAELNKVQIEVDTMKKAAQYQKNVTVNLAEGEAGALLLKNSADVASFSKIQNAQTEAYKKMKTELKMTNRDLLDYMKTKIVKDYDGKNMALNMASLDF
jgi:hypothetical protein